VVGNYNGIYFHNTNNSIAAFNTVSSNYVGVWLYGSHSSTFANNTITHNYPGIMLAQSTWNTLVNNTVFANNAFGIRLTSSAHNLVSTNDFIGNNGASAVYSSAHVQAYDDTGTSFWNGTAKGNYWSDWTSPDVNADGIVDAPYSIGGSSAKDNFPLTSLVIADQLKSIVVSPATASVIAGTSQTFTAQAFNQFGNVLPSAVITWSASSNIGKISATGGLFTAANVSGGVGNVTASSGTLSMNATVTVSPGPIDHIVVDPSSLTIVRGLSHQFVAIGQDRFNNSITGLAYAWSTTVGTITDSGTFIAQNHVGVGYVNVTAGGKAASVNVTVIFGELTYIRLVPATKNVVAGTNQSFTATGFDSSNNIVSGLVFSWTTNVGKMNGSTLNAQNQSGVSGYVRATSGLVNATAFVTITSAVLDHIELSPSSIAKVVAGTQHQFVATGKDANNNTISGLTFNWTTTAGTISADGRFQAQTLAGPTGKVTVVSGDRNASANVTIVPDQLTHIIISPGISNVSAGKSVELTAVGYDQYENPISGMTFTWATNVGRMNGQTFTAQNATGVTGFVSATFGAVTGYNVVNIPSPGADYTWMVLLALIVAMVGVAGYAIWRRNNKTEP
jgi:parallel beta-helix repeat protein